MRGLLPFLLLPLVACGGGAAADDIGVDAVAVDAPWSVDGGGSVDGGPLDGFGDLSGACGVLREQEWQSAGSFLFTNAIDFGLAGYTDDDLDLLSPGGQEIIADGNAGGSSLLSEVFAFEVLHRCERAALLKTETEIVYLDDGKITDLLVDIDARKVGVSVTRAYGYPPEDPYTVAQAQTLLEAKLADILDSSANVAAEDAWVRQILHVLAYQPEHAAAIATAYAAIDSTLRADTIVMVTVTDGDDEFIY